jgi:hypothetical protein
VFPGKRHTIKHLGFEPLRLLTEMLEVRILPGEPTPLSFNELRTFSGNLPSDDEVSSARIAINKDEEESTATSFAAVHQINRGESEAPLLYSPAGNVSLRDQ